MTVTMGADVGSRRRVEVLGVQVSAICMEEAIEEIARWIAEGHRSYVCLTGVHGVMESQRSPELRRIHNCAGLTSPDGMPLVWASHWAGASDVRRVYGPDLMLATCRRAASSGWRMFFYGAGPGVADQLASRLVRGYPGLVVVGTYSPPYGEPAVEEDEAIVERINDSGADIVWVGLSTPKQERWMSVHRDRLRAPVLAGVGAAFDIHAGTLRQAPPWMQRSGLEWLYRLGREPRRLWRRYAVNNPRFVWSIVRQPPRLLPAAASGSG